MVTTTSWFPPAVSGGPWPPSARRPDASGGGLGDEPFRVRVEQARTFKGFRETGRKRPDDSVPLRFEQTRPARSVEVLVAGFLAERGRHHRSGGSEQRPGRSLGQAGVALELARQNAHLSAAQNGRQHLGTVLSHAVVTTQHLAEPIERAGLLSRQGGGYRIRASLAGCGAENRRQNSGCGGAHGLCDAGLRGTGRAGELVDYPRCRQTRNGLKYTHAFPKKIVVTVVVNVCAS